MVIEQDLDQAQKGAAMHQELIWRNITFHVPPFFSRKFRGPQPHTDSRSRIHLPFFLRFLLFKNLESLEDSLV